VDHEGIALTTDSGETTAHVVYWDIGGSRVTHWYHNDAIGMGETKLSPSLTAAPVGVFADAGNDTYAWSGLAAPRICKLTGPTGTCAPGSVGQLSPTPASTSPDVKFPAAGGSDPTAVCPSASGQRCFDTQQPFSFAA